MSLLITIQDVSLIPHTNIPAPTKVSHVIDTFVAWLGDMLSRIGLTMIINDPVIENPM